MMTRLLGSSGIQASAIALGAWAIGGGDTWGNNDDQVSIRAIQTALDLGVNLIDTAPAYGVGHSEKIVGEAIKGRRHEVVLATKCGLAWHSQAAQHGPLFTEREGLKIYRTLSPASIRLEVEASLQRLQTDYIDLYQTHWPSLQPEAEPIAETMECLLQLKAEGKIRAIAASNVSIAQIQEYLAVGQLDAIQVRYSMLDRRIEQDLLPFCLEHNISILAYSPLEHGLLTGKIGMDRQFPAGDLRLKKPWLQLDNRQRVLAMLAGWQDLTQAYQCTLSQLVIAWTVAQPGLTFALCGGRKPEQVSDNAQAAKINLSPSDQERMRRDVVSLGSS